jgi:hypothetical protein
LSNLVDQAVTQKALWRYRFPLDALKQRRVDDLIQALFPWHAAPLHIDQAQSGRSSDQRRRLDDMAGKD